MEKSDKVSKDVYSTSIRMDNIQNPLTLLDNNTESYLDEISKIKESVKEFKNKVSRVEFLNESSLNIIQNTEYSKEIEEVVGEIQILMKSIKTSLQRLLNNKLNDPSQDIIRLNQYNVLKKQFMTELLNYQKVEVAQRQRLKERMRRQYRIVKPEATEEEMNEVINSDNRQSIFAQSVLQSTRNRQVKEALKDVQERHKDIQKLVQSIEDLNKLYHEMEYMVEKQDELVLCIDQKVEDTNTNLKDANNQLEKAIKLAISSRKKKFILLGILIIVLVIIIIIILKSLKVI